MRASAERTLVRYNEGPGFKLADSLILHPGVSVEGRYDSNALYGDASHQKGAGYLRIIGHIRLATPSGIRAEGRPESAANPRKINFGIKAAVAFRNYFSEDPAVLGQRDLEVSAGLGFNWNPGKLISLSLNDRYSRTVSARDQEGPETLARHVNSFGAALGISPGGGRLSFRVGYSLGIDAYENDIYSYNNKLNHGFSLGAKWKVLPKTAIFLSANTSIVDYYDPSGGPYVNVESFPLRVSLGLNGLITPFLSLSASAGIGAGFYDTGPTYLSVIASVNASLILGPLATLTLGFNHGFSDSIFGNYYTDEHVHIAYNHVLFKRLIVHLSGNYRFRTYAGLPQINGITIASTEFENHLASLSIAVDYKILGWIFVGLGYDLQIRSTPKNLAIQDLAGTNAYTKHQIFGKVGISY
jgi:hypothetical protein